MSKFNNTPRYWAGKNSKFDTWIFVAANLPVPYFEKYINLVMLNTANQNNGRISIELFKEIVRLCAEESNHMHMHEDFNETLMNSPHNWPVNKLIKPIKGYLDKLSQVKCPRKLLAFVVIMEYKIKCSSEAAILNPGLYNSGEYELYLKHFLLEHGNEEINHYHISLELYKQLKYSKLLLLYALLQYAVHGFISYHALLFRVMKLEKPTLKEVFQFFVHYMKRMWIGKSPLLTKTIIGLFGIFRKF